MREGLKRLKWLVQQTLNCKQESREKIGLTPNLEMNCESKCKTRIPITIPIKDSVVTDPGLGIEKGLVV